MFTSVIIVMKCCSNLISNRNKISRSCQSVPVMHHRCWTCDIFQVYIEVNLMK